MPLSPARGWWGLRVERSGTLPSRRQVCFFCLHQKTLVRLAVWPVTQTGTEKRIIVRAYSAERKEAIQRRMMPPENKSISELARETGITGQTLYAWRRQLKTQGVAIPGNGKNSGQWSSEDKFAVVLETATMNMAEQAEYCRLKGLFAEQITEWRQICQSANANAVQIAKSQREQGKGDQKRIQALEKELNRKEKALAEVAALLVLRKKAQAIWGDESED